MPTDERQPSTAEMEAYRGRVQGVLIDLTGVVAGPSLDEAQHLIDHGEPAEGLRSLAWAIAESNTRVPRSILDAIRELTEGLVSIDDMPPGLWPEGNHA